MVSTHDLYEFNRVYVPQTGKLSNGAPDFFPDINFCALGIANFLWGKIFEPLNAHVFFVLAGLHVYAVHACTMGGIIIE